MIYDVGYFRRLEEELTAQEIAGRCTNGMPSLDHSADTQVDSVFKSVHAGVVNALVSSYIWSSGAKGFLRQIFKCSLKENRHVPVLSLLTLIMFAYR